MLTIIKNSIKDIVKNLIGLDLRVPSYSQEGEDIILQILFQGRKNGFYVDIGSHHPKRFSNTFLLYRQGWHGINIDAMPGSMIPFQKIRPRDINLEIGISTEEGTKDFYIFEEPALNSFDAALAKQRIESGWKLDRITQIQLQSLNLVLDKYIPSNTRINLLSIDIEGLDEFVLDSLNFKIYCPEIIICETYAENVEDIFSTKIALILKKEGYILISKLCNSCIWKYQ